MWPDRRLTDLLGTGHPIIQAPMAGASTPEMAAAAANAGALGSLGLALDRPEQAEAEIRAAKALTNGALNLNFFCHQPPAVDRAAIDAAKALVAPYYAEFGLGEPMDPSATPPFDEARLALVLAASPRVVSFHFGLPPPDLLAPLKEAGIVVIASATSPKEAMALEAAGADAVIAQGWEAGGHRGVFDPADGPGEMGTMALVPAIVDRVSVPVIAAGGIGDGRGVAAAFMLGASGVQIGTAFLNGAESKVADAHKAALLASDGANTAVTSAFSGRPARGLRNRYMAETEGAVFPDFPLMNPLTGPLRKASAAAGSGAFMSLWSGQAAGLNRVEPTGQVVERLVAEAQSLLARG
ncbi:MAG: DUF561 domain-containing protein [Pseudomonadota bacterium]